MSKFSDFNFPPSEGGTERSGGSIGDLFFNLYKRGFQFFESLFLMKSPLDVVSSQQ